MKSLMVFAAALVLATSAKADGFDHVQKKSEFVSLISGKDLARFGITLKVSPDGGIEGKAFGTPVTGAWKWSEGLFCRDLYFGTRDLGQNCQMVKRKGNTIRFIADAGKGDFADLRIE